MQIALRDRVQIAWRAFRGVFKQPTLNDITGIYAGLFPGTMGTPAPRGMGEQINTYAETPWIHAGLNRIASANAAVEWKVFIERRAGEVRLNRSLMRGDYQTRRKVMKQLAKQGVLEEIEEHPLVQVLERPNDFMIGMTVHKLTSIYIELVGEAYWIKERNGFGMPVAFWPIPPHWVKNTPKPGNPFFEIRFFNWEGKIPATEIVWFIDPDPCNPYGRGVGLARPLSDEIETDEYSARYMKTFFYNNARPDVIVSGKDIQKNETKRLEEDWTAKHQGFWRAFKPYFLSGEVKVDILGQNFQHLQLLELRNSMRDTQLQVLGIPPEMQGIVENSNRATIEAATHIFARWVQVPRLEFVRATMQERLVPDYDPRLILDYVSPVEEDKEFKLKAATAAPWSITLDEWRDLQDREPLKNDQGQVFMVPLGVQPVRYEENDTFLLPEIEEPIGDEGETDEEAQEADTVEEAVRRKLLAKGLKAGEVEALIQIHRIARRMSPEMRKTFLAAVNAVKSKMSVSSIAAALESGSVGAVISKIPLASFTQKFQTSEKVLKDTLKLAGTYSAQLLSNQLGTKLTFDLTNPHAVYWVKTNGAKLVREVTEKTREGLQQLIQDGIIAGKPPKELAREIKERVGLTQRQAAAVQKFEQQLIEEGANNIEERVQKYADALLRQRSLNIARTETLNASNGGQQTLWLQARDEGLLPSAATTRQWLVTDDDRLDVNVCEPMDGQEVGLDEPFETGDGRFVMHPTAHPQCRCGMRLNLPPPKNMPDPLERVADRLDQLVSTMGRKSSVVKQVIRDHDGRILEVREKEE
ncbi:MAG TPA: phage portal protein [Candidatus Acidoferrales bacterium]|nr:phage portal protein [Candidatus Acidoferrales bacterium]